MKKLISLISILLLNSICFDGVAKSESVEAFFTVNKSTLELTPKETELMNAFVDSLVEVANDGRLDYVEVCGSASPEGPYAGNCRLADERGKALAAYLLKRSGLTDGQVRILPSRIGWKDLQSMVIEKGNTPNRDAVLGILDKFISSTDMSQVADELCQKRLKAIDNGVTYQWMLKNYFPQLRFATATIAFKEAEPTFNDTEVQSNPTNTSLKNKIDTDSTREEFLNRGIVGDNEREDETKINDISDSRIEAFTDTVSEVYHSQTVLSEGEVYRDSFHRLAVKTNLLYDALTLSNLEIEWLINKNWSVALEGDLAWWGVYIPDIKKVSLAVIMPEVKRWIRPRAPWHGFYVGALVGGGLYDIEKFTIGYRGEGVMGGVSVGFMWPIARCLSLEAEISGGYMYTRCKEYKPLDGHHVYQRTKNINYFGPLQAKFAFVWRLWDTKKNRKSLKNAEVRYEK